MCEKYMSGQKWRTSAFIAFCAAVYFLQLAAASQSETQTEKHDALEKEICDQGHRDETSNAAMYRCDLEQRLAEVPAYRLEGVLEYLRTENVETPKSIHQGSEKALAWKLLFYGFARTLQRSLIKQILSFILTKQGDYGCYDTVGCFYPKDRMALEIGGPVKPQPGRVKFYYHTNDSRHSEKEFNFTNWANVTGRNNMSTIPLTFLIHGFKEHKGTKQVVNLTHALLQHVRTEVIVVDWKDMAAFPYYGTAAANTPLVGAELSVLLLSMFTYLSLDPYRVHLIGFSLGAHAAGFCGRHFENRTGRKLRRITGLDPAGLLFENTNVTLSYTDAEYVDVVHTNGGDITDLRFGTREAIGHADFYANGGGYQPGCTKELYTITCSHNTAWWLFIDSVKNKSCPFPSIPCEDWNHYNACLSTYNSTPAQMGFYSDGAKANGTYYLRTESHSPYCLSHEKPDTGTKTNESANKPTPR